MSDDATITVGENADADRYEIHVDGALGGFAQYVRRNGRTYFVHTEIDPAFGGRGLGGQLVKAALDSERAAERPIVPLCPFVKAFVERHPAYQDLVDGRIVAAIDD
ncbi:GNAT family N-acetyltransferase [Desertimonas flava]|uniref:GNAT family N-acetyltransferase n=1 Tax=Desertimonas flava TaxID=2064846 RepID=UPI000E3431CF|nr:GNAT family N-acetyltransferase [Desertimonas flava]